MRIQVYQTDSVESALRRARVELGADAILLDSRKAPPEQRHLGLYEVRFATAGAPETEPQVTAAPSLPMLPTGEADLARMTRDLAEIRRLLYRYTPGAPLAASSILSTPQLGELYRQLIAGEVDPELAAELVAGLGPAAGARESDLEARLAEALGERVPLAPRLGASDAGPQTAALVGPPGAGKTTTIAKLAVEFGLRRNRRVHLLTVDSYRVGALDQLHALAAILGVELTAIEEVSDLAAQLDGFGRAGPAAPGLVLIDTPGLGSQQLGRAANLARFLASRRDVATHLVLSASTKPADLRRLADEFAVFGPARLLFTMLDETLGCGCVVNEAIRTGLPLSFLTAGPRIPEDIEPASSRAVAERILNRRSRAAAG